MPVTNHAIGEWSGSELGVSIFLILYGEARSYELTYSVDQIRIAAIKIHRFVGKKGFPVFVVKSDWIDSFFPFSLLQYSVLICFSSHPNFGYIE
jgi:hypothetical protein